MKLLLDASNGPITSRNVIISIPEEKTFSHYLNIPKEHEKNDDFILLTAKPDELQKFVTKYVNSEEAFKDGMKVVSSVTADIKVGKNDEVKVLTPKSYVKIFLDNFVPGVHESVN